VSECDHVAKIMRRPWPTRDCCAKGSGGGEEEIFTYSPCSTLYLSLTTSESLACHISIFQPSLMVLQKFMTSRTGKSLQRLDTA